MTGTVAILPVKRFDGAKLRLSEALSVGARRALAEAMLTDVLLALRRTEGLRGVIMVSGEPGAYALGGGYGAEVLDDPEQQGQSAAAQIGLRHALEAGADRALLVPGDCPALDPAELKALLERRSRAPSVVIVPDRHGTGTNALLLQPLDVIAPAFGPGSRALHEAAAAAAGAETTVLALDSLVLDVDTADDLEALRAALASRRGGAAHTRGLLSRLASQGGRPPAGSAARR